MSGMMTVNTKKDIFDAAEQDDLLAIRDFVEVKGIDVTSTNSFGQTVAHIAAKRGNLPIIKYAFDTKASIVTSKDRWNQSLLHLSVQNGTLEVVKYLVDSCNADILESDNKFSYSPCPHIAAAMGKLEVLKYFITEKQVDANLRNGLGQPCVFLAAAYTHLHIVKYLVEETNADLNMTDNNGQNILYMSATTGDLSIPKYILDEKMLILNVNAKDKLGETILNRAAVFNNYDFIKYVVGEKQADTEIPSNEGWTPLHVAASSGDLVLVKYLVENGGNLECVNSDGKMPSEVAADKKVIKYLEKAARKKNRRERRFLSTLELPPIPCNWIADSNDLDAVRSFVCVDSSLPYNSTIFSALQISE